jgi:hypothetical protein
MSRNLYELGNQGRLWTAWKTVAPATFTAQTSYVANGTSPTLLLRKTAGKKLTAPVRLDVSQDGTVAGALIKCVIKTDVLDRYSSGGNLWLIGNKRRDIVATQQPEFTVYDSPTASSEAGAGADPRTVFEGTIFQTVTGLGTNWVYDFDECDELKAAGSILIYFFAAGTAPTLRGTLLVMEQ